VEVTSEAANVPEVEQIEISDYDRGIADGFIADHLRELSLYFEHAHNARGVAQYIAREVLSRLDLHFQFRKR
jgi:hypothetical protein